MPKVTFEPNMPVAVTLRAQPPELVDSQYNGSEYLYKTAEGLMYVPVHVKDLITACGAAAGSRIAITKRKRKIGQQWHEDWSVEPVTIPPMPETQASQANANRANQASSQANTPAALALGNPLAQALVLAIDAAVIASEHARAVGLALAWRSEDIRALAATILINRERRA
ncbi:MAG: hypothetical protein JNL98_17715 [Bryobacterales bacterium]|nr:hypothetical protein [Bryobacterales bacterium]